MELFSGKKTFQRIQLLKGQGRWNVFNVDISEAGFQDLVRAASGLLSKAADQTKVLQKICAESTGTNESGDQVRK